MLSRRNLLGLGLLLIAILLTVSAPAVQAMPPDAPLAQGQKDKGNKSDHLKDPASAKQYTLKQKALQDKLQGKPVGKVHQVAKGQYVELAREGEDTIWTVIGEFGTQKDPSYGGAPGPLHNQIPMPDRTMDNTTFWVPDFNQAHYQNLLFAEGPGANSMRTYYIEQSSNRYAVNGAVTNWVQVPFNEARYGSNYCGDIVCATTWYFIGDSINAWYNGQIAAGKTPAEINAYLAQFDKWDRYDYDGDGNFNEPDGYIDHFQSIHAGQGEEDIGDPDAIWSHSWYAFYNLIGVDGPSFNKYGGLRIGNSNYWVGKYTIEPETGGVGVFVHEYGHDLGLPDLYDTAGNTCGSACENSTGFWTLMSGGSNTGSNTEGLVTRPTHLGVWEKFQLGWLNYEVAFAGKKSEHKLGPAETNTKQAQGLFVVLPDKQVTVNLGAAFAGTKYYYSSAGNNLDNWMYRQFALPAGAMFSAKVRYDIETDWDYAYLVVSTDNGATWTNVATNLSSATNPNGQNFGNGITDTSGGAWVDLTASLSAFSGNVLLGFRYWTDGAVAKPGFMADNLQVTGSVLDGAETNTGWTYVPATGGFRVTTGTEVSSYFNAYVVEYRQYRGYDVWLRDGVYNFGFLNTKPDWVEHFPYQDGLLISYWDGSQTDNSTSAHPGVGLLLPIDAHPEPLLRPDSTPWRARIQSYDTTFGMDMTDKVTLHVNGVESKFGGLPGVPMFDDRNQYWRAQTPTAGVKNPNTNTQIRIQSISAQDSFMQVEVRPAK